MVYFKLNEWALRTNIMESGYSSSSFFEFNAVRLSIAIGENRIARMVNVSEYHDFAVTEPEDPDVASLMVPLYLIHI